MVNKNLYINGLIVTIIVVVGLLLINFFVDQKRTSKLNDEFLSYSWDMDESRLFLLFLDYVGGEGISCPILKQRLTQLANHNTQFLEKIDKYENVNIFSKQYLSLKKTFSLRNMELFFYYSKYRKECDDSANYIVYFYLNDKECNDCKIQANILNNVRDMCSNVIIFALPSDSDSDIINLFKIKYNIIKEPSIVINGNQTFSGVISRPNILEKITCKKEKVLN